jgi:chemotaxis protein CheD
MNAPAAAEVFLGTGQFFFGGGQTRVRTLLGTCVAIVVWHPRSRIGGMCHYLLPSRSSLDTKPQRERGMFADDVMRLFEKELALSSTRPEEYVVKLFGGGSMFADDTDAQECSLDPCTPVERMQCHEVGCRNVKAGRELLSRHGFRIAAEHVGGHGSRHLVFDLATGDVWIRHSTDVLPGGRQKK